ncbi:MAG: shikimate kinase [Trueperaceae bacterium]
MARESVTKNRRIDYTALLELEAQLLGVSQREIVGVEVLQSELTVALEPDDFPETVEPFLPLERPVSWLALVGFMGTGKSRIGWELSRRLSLTFIDTDKVIERISCMRISDIFEYYGEATFRDYESEVVRRSLRLEHVVVSTGGGTVMRSQNREMLKSRGPVVLLSASPETIYLRTRRNQRPLLQVENPIEKICELLEARKEAYRDVAAFEVSTDNRQSEEVVEEIVDKLWKWQENHS